MSDIVKQMVSNALWGGGSGSSGGGLPSGGAPHQVLVTDEKGTAGWQDRLCYETLEDVVNLAETELADTGDGSFMIFSFDHTPVAGGMYTVIYNGAQYQCEAINSEFAGMEVVVLGTNAEEYTEGDVPFQIMVLPEMLWESIGAAAQLIPLDGSESVTLSMRGKKTIVKKIDPKFIEVKGETVFVPIYVSNDMSTAQVPMGYVGVKAMYDAGKYIVGKIEFENALIGSAYMPLLSITERANIITFGDGLSGKVELHGDGSVNFVSDPTLRAPDGTMYRINVSNDGTLSAMPL